MLKSFKILTNIDLNANREQLIKLYHKYFILLNGYDRMDSFLKVTNTVIEDYLDKDIYSDAVNYKMAVNLVNSLNNKNSYLLIYKNNSIIGIARLCETKKTVKILELVCDNRIYKKVLRYLEKYYKEKNFNKIYLEMPINDIKLLILSNKMNYFENPKDIQDKKKYIVSKEI